MLITSFLGELVLICECAPLVKGIIHRDIKPDNFVVGHGDRASYVHIIDFGVAKGFKCLKTEDHIPYKEGRVMVGTASYASISAHRGIERSRCDDLEALGYVLLFLLLGQLPWQGLKENSKAAKNQKMRELKEEITLPTLRGRDPMAFETYIRYCRSLCFEEKPDYIYMREIFVDCLKRSGFQYDYVYDWTA